MTLPISRKTPTRITLWGANQTGQTTYLASSSLAALRADDPWRVTGADEASSDWLQEQTFLLLSGRFPPATVKTSQYRLAWSYDKRTSRCRPGRKEVAFEVDVLDVPSALYKEPPGGRSDQWYGLLDHILGCDGLIYLYDPLRNKEQAQALQTPLYQRARETDRLTADGRLPHVLAVCVTKFDDPRIFQRAQPWITRDMGTAPLPNGPEGQKNFFEKVADDPTQEAISKYFHPDRTGYFVTSAIGFFRGPEGKIDFRAREDGTLDPESYPNVVAGPDGIPRIRGEVWPEGVVEPWGWIARQLSPTDGGSLASLSTSRREPAGGEEGGAGGGLGAL